MLQVLDTEAPALVDPEVLEICYEVAAEEEKELGIKQIANLLDAGSSPVDIYRTFRVLSCELGKVFFQKVRRVRVRGNVASMACWSACPPPIRRRRDRLAYMPRLTPPPRAGQRPHVALQRAGQEDGRGRQALALRPARRRVRRVLPRLAAVVRPLPTRNASRHAPRVTPHLTYSAASMAYDNLHAR